jgi:hypothetical protein
MSHFKKLFFVASIIFSTTTRSFCQNNDPFTYLVVRFEEKYNTANKNFFAAIYAEATNPYAQKIYNLIPYDGRKNAVNIDAVFYTSHSDTATKVYNYFQNPTEGLQFLAEDNWVLITAYSEIIPTTPLSSRGVYCFKKQITSK